MTDAFVLPVLDNGAESAQRHHSPFHGCRRSDAVKASIARDAAALKARALRRIEELEREQPHGD